MYVVVALKCGWMQFPQHTSESTHIQSAWVDAVPTTHIQINTHPECLDGCSSHNTHPKCLDGWMNVSGCSKPPVLVSWKGFPRSAEARASWRGAMGWRIRPWRWGQSAIAAAAGGKRSFNRIPWTDGLQVCVVGSGPAGFYTAEKVRKGQNVRKKETGLDDLILRACMC